MYILRKQLTVTFIADGRLHCALSEVSLRGKNDSTLHNVWANVCQKVNTTIYALKSEDVDIENGQYQIDHHTFVCNKPFLALERHRRPENRNCILCSLEQLFSTEEVEIEILETNRPELAEDAPYTAMLLWVGAGSLNPQMLYTDKKELDKKTILIARVSDLKHFSPDTVVHLFADNVPSHVDNNDLCETLFVLKDAHQEIGYVKD